MDYFRRDVPEGKKDLLAKAGEAAFSENGNELDQARNPYRILVESYPREANVHYVYGKFLSKLDQDEAIKEYEKELEVSPSHVPARIEAGYLYLKKGDFDSFVRSEEQTSELQ